MQRIAALSEHFPDVGSPAPEEGSEAAREDWWIALKFWFGCSFMRGRRDALSVRFMEAAVEATAKILGDGERTEPDRVKQAARDGWLNWRQTAHTTQPFLSALANNGVNNSMDRKMVADSLAFVIDLPELNIVAWAISEIEQGRLRLVFYRLQRIHGVAEKLASLFLKEVVHTYDLGARCTAADYQYVFPIDTWVETVCIRLGLFEGDESLEEKTFRALAACELCNVDPIRFNQGAWYLGYARGDQGIDSVCALDSFEQAKGE